ncbi:MAG: AI-2E family transporter, partial [Leptolyngbyaceae cyanobacterium CSU_1_4]|nr:AI-2E family transporter [Leptolyngbyaceae cyanobacterium CSU_1_4]
MSPRTLAVAAILAYLLDPVVDWLEHKQVPRTRAIILVFFVAVMLTPWLMLRLGQGKSHGHAHDRIGLLGRIYVAVARPILASRTRSSLFLAVVGV